MNFFSGIICNESKSRFSSEK